MSEYNGKCPVCSGQLVINDGVLHCAVTPKHFEIKEKIYKDAFKKWGVALTKYQNEEITFESFNVFTNALLKTLLDNNTAPEKPEIK